MDKESIINAEETSYDKEENNNSIRPKGFDDFLGQNNIKSKLKVFIKSALKRDVSLDHILFYGPPGLGKTTLAQIIANEMGSSIKATSAPIIERPGDLASILTTLGEKDILFIDEIHRLRTVVEEVLYSAMEDFFVDIKVGEGTSAKSFRVKLPHFTLIGATTRSGLLSTPLYDRFGIVERLELYNSEELTTIVKRSANILNIAIENDAAVEIAKRSRGTPRIANRLLKRVRDYAAVLGNGTITLDIAKIALNKLDIDDIGLDSIDRRLLRTLIEKYQGRPVGIETLATTLGEEVTTIEDVYEPYLIQIGYISRTPRGRIALPEAYKHLGIEYNEN